MGVIKEVKTITVYTYNGKKYKTLKEIAIERGVKQVSKRDFERLGIEEHFEGEIVETEVEGKESEEAWESEPLEETDKDKPLETLYNGELEKLYKKSFLSEEAKEFEGLSMEEFAKKIKKTKSEVLVGIVSSLELDYKESENEGINRMRLIMALRKFYFPDGEKYPTEPKSDFVGMGLETLKNLADNLGLSYKVYPNDKITKMRLIEAIKKAKK